MAIITYILLVMIKGLNNVIINTGNGALRCFLITRKCPGYFLELILKNGKLIMFTHGRTIKKAENSERLRR